MEERSDGRTTSDRSEDAQINNRDIINSNVVQGTQHVCGKQNGNKDMLIPLNFHRAIYLDICLVTTRGTLK